MKELSDDEKRVLADKLYAYLRNYPLLESMCASAAGRLGAEFEQATQGGITFSLFVRPDEVRRLLDEAVAEASRPLPRGGWF